MEFVLIEERGFQTNCAAMPNIFHTHILCEELCFGVSCKLDSAAQLVIEELIRYSGESDYSMTRIGKH